MASKDGNVPEDRPSRTKRSHPSSASSVVNWDSTHEELNDDSENVAALPVKKKQRRADKEHHHHQNQHGDNTDTGATGGCLVCGMDNDHGKLLLCEVCNGEYHTYCLVPPLRSIPEGEWFCDRCKQVDNLEAMVSALPESYTSRFGEICWAQGGVGYGWWPACIYDPRLTIGVARLQAMKHLGRKHLVYFFECSETPFEILADSKIMVWEQGILEDCHLGKTSAKSASKGRLAEFRCAVHAASIEESKPKERRLDWNHQGVAAAAAASSSPPSPVRPEAAAEGGGANPSNTKQQHQAKGGKHHHHKGGKPPPPPHPEHDKPAKGSAGPGRPKKKRRAEGDSHAGRGPSGSSSATSGHQHDIVVEGDDDDEDGDTEMYCTIFRDRGPTHAKTRVGFVRIHSRQRSTFAQLRRVIENDLVPDAIPVKWRWRFLLPKLGPLSTKQESKFGPFYPFLLQASDGDVGDGSLPNPVEISLVDVPNQQQQQQQSSH